MLSWPGAGADWALAPGSGVLVAHWASSLHNVHYHHKISGHHFINTSSKTGNHCIFTIRHRHKFRHFWNHLPPFFPYLSPRQSSYVLCPILSYVLSYPMSPLLPRVRWLWPPQCWCEDLGPPPPQQHHRTTAAGRINYSPYSRSGGFLPAHLLSFANTVANTGDDPSRKTIFDKTSAHCIHLLQ